MRYEKISRLVDAENQHNAAALEHNQRTRDVDQLIPYSNRALLLLMRHASRYFAVIKTPAGEI